MKNTVFREIKGSSKDEMKITGESLQEKELALFGYRFYDSGKIPNIAYTSDSEKKLRDLMEYNEITFFKNEA